MQKSTHTSYKYECDICLAELVGGSGIRSDSAWVEARVEPIEGRQDRRYAGVGPDITTLDVCDECKTDPDKLRDLAKLILSKCNSAEELAKGEEGAQE